jgi:hypothetical protein
MPEVKLRHRGETMGNKHIRKRAKNKNKIDNDMRKILA